MITRRNRSHEEAADRSKAPASLLLFFFFYFCKSGGKGKERRFTNRQVVGIILDASKKASMPSWSVAMKNTKAK